MFLVALLALRTTVEEEARALTVDLGLGATTYETALLLRAPSPALLLQTNERERALRVLAQLRARGHDAVACDANAVVRSAAMVHIRAFRLEPDAFVLMPGNATDERDEREERVPWSEVCALVRATHRTREDQSETTSARTLSLGRAAMSGGLMLTKKVANTKTQSIEEREPVLYVFRRGGTPLLLRLSTLRYAALGSDLRPSQRENFSTLVRKLREHAVHAPFDERLLAPRPHVDRVRVAGAGPHRIVSASSADHTDLLAHLVALACASPRPHR